MCKRGWVGGRVRLGFLGSGCFCGGVLGWGWGWWGGVGWWDGMGGGEDGDGDGDGDEKCQNEDKQKSSNRILVTKSRFFYCKVAPTMLTVPMPQYEAYQTIVHILARSFVLDHRNKEP